MLRRGILLLAALGLAACGDIPTEAPQWDQTWVVPGEEISVSVAELLPSGVALNADTSAFLVDAPGASITLSLSGLCSLCTSLDGLTVPKPAFGDTLTTSTTLPADLVAASLAGGSLDVTLAHNLGFDPLRPASDPAAERGWVVVRITSNGAVVASDSMSGWDTAFPAGTPLTPSLPIQPVDVSRDLQLEVRLFSPTGDATTIHASDTLGVRLAPSTVAVASATVNASSITVDPTITTMDFGGVEPSLIDRVQTGALRYHVQNPFDVTGTLDVVFNLGFQLIQKHVSLEPGSYDGRLEFTGTELRDILGAGVVNVATSGTVGSTAGTVTVTPSQELAIDTDFELVLLVGATPEGQ